MNLLYKQSLEYHKQNSPGKLETTIIKPASTKEDLSLAYSPWVSAPCLEIEKDHKKVDDYTWRKNTVCVVSDGTAVLGLGDIGPYAALPVMEGKSLLFKKFAGLNSVPLCLSGMKTEDGKVDIDKMVEVIATLEPSFGGINLEDIKAPECFEIERRLDEKLNIPVFHDDQHGTAVVTLAGIFNSLILVKKKIEEVKVVINGAGAAGIAIAKILLSAGVPKENIIMCDSRGVIYEGRKEGMNIYKEQFAVTTIKRTLADALENLDIFIGCSKGNLLTDDMVKSMAKDSIIFALANPDPEILPEKAKKLGVKIIGTGRSDYPNQINNILAFPGIFKGALQIGAKTITHEMKVAAARAISDIAREPLTDEVRSILKEAYKEEAEKGFFDNDDIFSCDCVLPKPFDLRVVKRVCEAVKRACH